MQIKIAGRGIEITAPLRDYIHEKIGKFEELFSNIQKVEVILSAKSIDNAEMRQVAEIRAWLSRLAIIQATEAGRDMYSAIDLAAEEAKRQISRHKEKLIHEQRRKAEKFKHERFESPPTSTETGPALVKLNRFADKPMNIEEAKEELKNSELLFLAFRNVDSGAVHVLRKIDNTIESLQAQDSMSAEDAVEYLKNNEQNLLFFNNTDTKLPTVVFKRKTGNFGLIEPEI